MTEEKNPFRIKTPEDMSAEDVVSLFVNVFTDFPKVIETGHLFLNGPRGSGKSMMFRYMEPDCQMLARRCSIKELPFYSIYVPLRNANFARTEIKRLEGKHATAIINEHLMVMHIAIIVINKLIKLGLGPGNDRQINEMQEYYENIFLRSLKRAMWKEDDVKLKDNSNLQDILKQMLTICEDIYDEAYQYVKNLNREEVKLSYNGPITDYLDFLFPIIDGIRELSFLPNGATYLLIDDADNLSTTQAKVLNSWVSTRTSEKVSIKISTQYKYKTFYTTNGYTVDTPHDYTEVNISTIYTGSMKTRYMDRIKDIIQKRLSLHNINRSPYEYFPSDHHQEDEIERIRKEYFDRHKAGSGRGSRPSDDVTRYARPDYIKSLAGTRKSSYSYSYAGFEQLVHLSSGIIRYFLESAFHMFTETQSKHPGEEKKYIIESIQNSIVRDMAEKFLFEGIERVKQDEAEESPPKEIIEKMQNMINALGGLFRQCLLSDRSERRVFSFALSDQPNEELCEVLELAVWMGYLQKSTIGRKDKKSGGRTRLYILSRRLSPIWTLDPTSFAGYLFMTSDILSEAIYRPYNLLRRIERNGLSDDLVTEQLRLF